MASITLPVALRVALASSLLALLAAACANGAKVVDPGGSGGAGGAGGAPVNEVCRLHSCDIDAECGGCAEGKRLCLAEEHRCVACDAAEGGCAEGEFCSDFGTCVPMGQECPTDDGGSPTIVCTSPLDCLACDSLHQACDVASGKCVTCTDDNVRACADTNACNGNRCSECSASVACPQGSACSPIGTCIADCGPDTTPCETTSASASSGAGGAGGAGSTSSGSSTTGSTSSGSTSSGGTNECHDTCTSGAPMTKACDACTAKLCTADPFCCVNAWDEQCVTEVGQYCDAPCPAPTTSASSSGSGSSSSTGGVTCVHGECTAGAALTTSCSTCASQVCAADAYCCTTKWDAKCVGEVDKYCPTGC